MSSLLSMAHHDRKLLLGWRELATKNGWLSSRLGDATGACFDVYWSQGERSAVDLYLSAGIHGDEPAAVWGLWSWVSQNIKRLREVSMLIAPCINPFGLRRNERFGPGGVDLNRCFDDESRGWVRQWRRAIGLARPELSLLLHEDYDGSGCYLYELVAPRSKRAMGRECLAAAALQLGVDTRSSIDGQRAKAGYIRRRPDLALPGGQPEALALGSIGGGHSLTFETPSEACFDLRVAAHVAFLEASYQHWLKRAE